MRPTCGVAASSAAISGLFNTKCWSCEPKRAASGHSLTSLDLNPVETVRDYLRANNLGNGLFDAHDTIVDRYCTAWNWNTETPDRIRSIVNAPWSKTITAM